MEIIEDDRLGRCFLHRRTITKGLVKEKDYKCAGCGHALKYDRNFWRTSTNVKKYLTKKGLKFAESKTQKGYPTLITKKVEV